MLTTDVLARDIAPLVEQALAARGVRLTTPRWTLVEDGARPLTVNRAKAMHHQAWATRIKATRGLWWHLADMWQVPRLNRARITAVPLHADRRTPQDTSACAPHVKAAVDGLIDAGILYDDTADFLPLIAYTGPLVCGINGLALVVEDIG